MHKIYIDADGCPVIPQTLAIAEAFHLEVILVCDTAHFHAYDGVEVILVGTGKDAADFVLLRKVKENDIIITQDYGLAALALTKGAMAISQHGFSYTKENIDILLAQRHIAYLQRKQGRDSHTKKRTKQDDDAFCDLLESILVIMEKDS